MKINWKKIKLLTAIIASIATIVAVFVNKATPTNGVVNNGINNGTMANTVQINNPEATYSTGKPITKQNPKGPGYVTEVPLSANSIVNLPRQVCLNADTDAHIVYQGNASYIGSADSLRESMTVTSVVIDNILCVYDPSPNLVAHYATTDKPSRFVVTIAK